MARHPDKYRFDIPKDESPFLRALREGSVVTPARPAAGVKTESRKPQDDVEESADWVRSKARQGEKSIEEDIEEKVRRAGHPRAGTSVEPLPEDWFSRSEGLRHIDDKYAPDVHMRDDGLFIDKISAADFIANTAKPKKLGHLSDEQWKEYLEEWVEDRKQEFKVSDSLAASAAPEPEPAPAAPVRPRDVIPVPPVPPPEPPPLRRPAAPRVDRIPTPAPIPEPIPAARPEAARTPEQVGAPTWDDAFELFKTLHKLNEDLKQAKSREEHVSRGLRGAFYSTFLLSDQDRARYRVQNLEQEIERIDKEYKYTLRVVATQERKKMPDIEEEFRKYLHPEQKVAEQPIERTGLVPPAPTRAPGESSEMFQSRWDVWKDAAKSSALAIPRFAWGALSVLLGVRAAQTTAKFVAEHLEVSKATKTLQGLMSEFSTLATQADASPDDRELERKADAKVDELNRAVEALISSKRIPEEATAKFRGDIRRILEQHDNVKKPTEQERNQQIARALKDHFQHKATGLEAGKQLLNTGLLLSGWQFARAVGYGGLTLLQRAHRARADYEKGLNIEARDKAGMWDKARESGVLKDITVQAVKEHAKGLTGILGPLFAGTPISKAEWAEKKAGFEKSLGALMIALGLTKVAHAEFMETGPSAQIDLVLDKLGRDGLHTTLGDNYVHGVAQLFGKARFGKDGELKVAPHPDQGFAKPILHPEMSPQTEAELRAQAEANFFKAHPEYQRLEAASHGKIDVQGLADGEHVRIEMAFKGDIQQEVRDMVTAVVAKADGKFSTLEAAHAENMVANLTNLLHGKDLRFMQAEDLDGVAHIGDHKIVIDDAGRFHEIVTQLKAHAEGKLTAANLAAHHELVATINNTSDSNWQHDVNVGTGVPSAGGAGYVAVHLDHAAIHQAEIAVAHQYVEELELPGAHVEAVDVTDEDTFTMHIGDADVSVDDGFIDRVVAPIPGDPTHTHHLNVAMDDPRAAERIENTLKHIREEAADAASHGNAAEAAAAVARGLRQAGESLAASVDKTPHFVNDLVKTVEEGGLKGADGKLHFGSFALEERWFQNWDDKDVNQFINEAPGRFSPARLFSSENDAHYKLAHAMELHKADPKMTVGHWAVENYKKIEEWTR